MLLLYKKYQKNFQPCPICRRAKSTKSKTCSYCAKKGSGSKTKRKYIERICPICLGVFSIPEWRIKQDRGKYCSRECKDKYQKTLKGVKSPKWKGGTNKRYGSKSTAWRVMRLWALEKANHHCQLCKKPVKGFNAIPHHLKPYSKCENPEEAFGPKNIKILCRSCHSKVERLGRTTNQKGQFITKEK